MKTVKGSHIVQAQKWIDSRLGAGTFAELTSSAGDTWRLILPMSWYDVDILSAVLVQAARRSGVSVEDMTTEIARMNAEADLASIYKFFMRVAQPERVLAHTPRLWRTYVSFGEAKAIQNKRGHYIGQGDGFEPNLVDWACGCWLGFIPTAIRMSGGKDPRGIVLKKWRDMSGRYSAQFEVTYH